MKSDWIGGAGVAPFPTHEIHLWRLHATRFATYLAAYDALLSAPEKAQAQRYQSPPARQRYILGHGMARLLISHMAQVAPQDLIWQTNRYGKPSLQPLQRADTPLPYQFNIAHNDHWILCALAHQRPVGVDVETIRPTPDDLPAMAKYCLHPDDYHQFLAHPAAQVQLFYQHWTQKEAYLKALGIGIATQKTMPMLKLSPRHDHMASIIDPQPVDSRTWYSHLIPLDATSLAALVYPAETPLHIQKWDWQW